MFPDHKVYYFEGWGKDARAEVFVRKVRAAGRRASVASCGSVDYTMVTVTRLGRREAKPEVTRVHEAGVAGAIARGELLFAVIDQDEDTVWGIGETAEEALADAKVWVAERREDAPAVDLRAVEIDPAAAQAVLDGCVEIAPFNQATTTLALRRDRIEIAR